MEKLRFKVQLGLMVFFNIGLFRFHSICFPVLNCHSCPASIFACPLGVMGQFAGVGLVPLTVVGGVLLAGLLAGRFLCGWACPFGFIQDLLHRAPYIKFDIPSWTRFIKYGALLLLVIAVPMVFSTEFPLYFCRICPVGTIESAIPWAVMNGTSNVGWLAIRLAVLFVILVAAMGHRRFFCKVLCPLGAFLSVTNRFAAIFPERTETCTECGYCGKVCPMETSRTKGAPAVFDTKPEECISCLECRVKCPTEAVRLWGG